MEKINVAVYKKEKTSDKAPDYAGNTKDKKVTGAVWLKPSTKNVNENILSISVSKDDIKYQGLAFPNTKTKPIHPDFTGSSQDKKYRFAVWVKPDQQNTNEISYSIQVSDNNYVKPV